jgi:hypothetical protein
VPSEPIRVSRLDDERSNTIMTTFGTSTRGPLDLRWAKWRIRSTPDQLTLGAAGLAEVPDGLDWDAFCGRYFSGTRRHDLQAASTYEAYMHGSTV